MTSDSDEAMRENMEYTLELADKILRSSKDPLNAFMKAVGTLAQVIHIITADDQREETLKSMMSICVNIFRCSHAHARGARH